MRPLSPITERSSLVRLARLIKALERASLSSEETAIPDFEEFIISAPSPSRDPAIGFPESK